MTNKYITKTGQVNKNYIRKLWNHVTDTAVDSFNGKVDKHKLKVRVIEFSKMVDKLTNT